MRAQLAALRARGRHRPADSPGRVAAGVDRDAGLPVVAERVARALAAGVVEVAVRTELEPAAGVARVLLAPILDQDLLRTGHRLAAHLQAGDAPAHDASVLGAPGRGRTGVAPARCRTADRGVVDVKHIDVWLRGIIRVHRDAHQPAVDVVVDLCAQIGELSGARVGQVREGLDDPALLRYEDTAVRSELDRDRTAQPGECVRLLKAGRKRGCTRGGDGHQRDGGEKGQADAHHQAGPRRVRFNAFPSRRPPRDRGLALAELSRILRRLPVARQPSPSE